MEQPSLVPSPSTSPARIATSPSFRIDRVVRMRSSNFRSRSWFCLQLRPHTAHVDLVMRFVYRSCMTLIGNARLPNIVHHVTISFPWLCPVILLSLPRRSGGPSGMWQLHVPHPPLPPPLPLPGSVHITDTRTHQNGITCHTLQTQNPRSQRVNLETWHYTSFPVCTRADDSLGPFIGSS